MPPPAPASASTNTTANKTPNTFRVRMTGR